jgi:hypothetical protein
VLFDVVELRLIGQGWYENENVSELKTRVS